MFSYMDLSAPLITIFGCGYVGTALAEKALGKGWQVRALTRNEQTGQRLRDLGVDVLIADLADRNWHRRWTERGDFLVNTVSAASRSLDGYRHSYLEGMKSLIAWAAAGKGKSQLVYTSSTSVYPQVDGSDVREGDTGFHFEGLRPNAEVLLEAEALLEEPLPGLSRAFVLRLAGIYGPGRHYMLDQLREGRTEFAGVGDYWINLIHRDDIVSAVFAALESPAEVSDRIFNVSDGHPVLKQDLVQWLADRLNLGRTTFNPAQQTTRQASRSDSDGRLPHRVVRVDRIIDQLGWIPQYPDYKAGYSELIA